MDIVRYSISDPINILYLITIYINYMIWKMLIGSDRISLLQAPGGLGAGAPRHRQGRLVGGPLAALPHLRARHWAHGRGAKGGFPGDVTVMPYEIIWNQYKSYEIIWNHMKSYEIIWNQYKSTTIGEDSIRFVIYEVDIELIEDMFLRFLR